MSDSFLGRWSKRKEAVREGKPVAPEPEVAPVAPPAQAVAGTDGVQAVPAAPAPADGGDAPPERPPLPTLADVQALAPGADVSRFMQAGVPADVRSAAMKKLFADPHFNIMDGLDTYIDDYSKPDPIPPEMLRQLASAKFLKLFDDEEKEQKDTLEAEAGAPREVADDPPPESVAQSEPAPADPAVPPPADPNAHPDLRLQQDDAPGREEPGGGAR